MTKAEKLYLSSVAALGCIICRMPAEIHHPRTGQGMGKKARHDEAIPLCPSHHRNGGYGVAFHAGKKAFELNFGTQQELLIKTNQLLQG